MSQKSKEVQNPKIYLVLIIDICTYNEIYKISIAQYDQ